jgi:hypothetical protein
MRPASSAIAVYALSVASVAAALGVSLLLGRILPFTFLLAAVALWAWFGGTRTGTRRATRDELDEGKGTDRVV